MLTWLRNLALEGYSRSVLGVQRKQVERLFDRSFYAAKYPDVARTGLDPVTHFLLFGAAELRLPHRLFDTAYYAASNPDAPIENANPLVHFLTKGWKECRRPNPLFDPEWYARTYGTPAGVNPLLDFIRRSARGEALLPSPPIADALASPPPEFVIPPLTAPVDVIVRGSGVLPEIRTAVEALADSRFRLAFDVVIVESPALDAETARYLQNIAGSQGWTLFRENWLQGASKAIELRPDRDIVLLDSGMQPSGDWLDRLAAAAYSAPKTGIVVPFSNCGGSAGYPRRDRPWLVPDGAAAELDAAFREGNGARTVSLPRVEGGCAFVRRDYLRDAGFVLDESCFDAGGGAPRFVFPASNPPWKHLLAAGVFIPRRMDPEAPSITPDPIGRQEIPRESDPAAPFRFAASALRLQRCGRPVVLAIGHALGGGVSESIIRWGCALRDRNEFVLLTPAENAVIFESLNADFAFSLALDGQRDYRMLLDLIGRCGVVRMHIHHVLGHVLDLKRLARDLGIPFDFTVHDYYAVCPQVHLTDQAGDYCGEPDESGCNRCLAARPARSHSSIESWRRGHAWLIDEAQRVIAPSFDTAARMERRFPGRRISVVPHPEAEQARTHCGGRKLRDGEPLRIALLGVLAPHKGLHKIRACARLAASRRLPLEFHLLGYIDRSVRRKHEPFAQTGPYDSKSLPALLARIDPHLIWFAGEAPETYSFALSTARSTGLPLVVPDIGALPERTRGDSWTWVIPYDWDADSLADFFMRIRARNFIPDCPPDSGSTKTPVAAGHSQSPARDGVGGQP